MPPMRLVFRVHAIRRMFERGIRRSDVEECLAHGETIEEYPDDTPLPSRLVLGRTGGRPLHVVVAQASSDETVVITAYEPDPARWDSGLQRRKP